jgi:hypothetical protein
METLVLAHVGQVGRHQSDRPGAEFARGLCGKTQRKRRSVRVAQSSQHNHVGIGKVRFDRHQRFAVWEAAPTQGRQMCVHE